MYLTLRAQGRPAAVPARCNGRIGAGTFKVGEHTLPPWLGEAC